MRDLKHLFYVHSPTTFLVAYKIIKSKQLRLDHVVFLTYRGFKVPFSNFSSFTFPFHRNPEPFPFKLNFLKCRKKLREFDEFVNSVTNGTNFSIYLPHTSFRVLKLLITHKKCVAYNYIEEGLSSYNLICEVNPVAGKIKINRIDNFIYQDRIKDKLFFNVDYTAVYGLFEESFPGFRNRIILDKEGNEHVLLQQTTHMQNLTKFNNAHIIVLDAASVHGKTTLAFYKKAVCQLVKNLKWDGRENVFIKFHPAQVGTEEYFEINEEINRVKGALMIEEIPQDIFLEFVAQCCSSVNFYVNFSSIGWYACQAGQKVYCWAKYVTELDEKFEEEFTPIHHVMFNKMEFL